MRGIIIQCTGSQLRFLGVLGREGDIPEAGPDMACPTRNLKSRPRAGTGKKARPTSSRSVCVRRRDTHEPCLRCRVVTSVMVTAGLGESTGGVRAAAVGAGPSKSLRRCRACACARRDGAWRRGCAVMTVAHSGLPRVPACAGWRCNLLQIQRDNTQEDTNECVCAFLPPRASRARLPTRRGHDALCLWGV